MKLMSLAMLVAGIAVCGSAEAQYRSNSSSGTMNFNNPQSSLVQTMIDNPYKTRGGSSAAQGSSAARGSSASSGRAVRSANTGRSSGSKVARDAAKAAAAAAAIGIAAEILSSGSR